MSDPVARLNALKCDGLTGCAADPGREIPHSCPWEDPDITTMIGDAIVES